VIEQLGVVDQRERYILILGAHDRQLIWYAVSAFNQQEDDQLEEGDVV
jgi:hypothetical protein